MALRRNGVLARLQGSLQQAEAQKKTPRRSTGAVLKPLERVEPLTHGMLNQAASNLNLTFARVKVSGLPARRSQSLLATPRNAASGVAGRHGNAPDRDTPCGTTAFARFIALGSRSRPEGLPPPARRLTQGDHERAGRPLHPRWRYREFRLPPRRVPAGPCPRAGCDGRGLPLDLRYALARDRE